MPCVILLNDYIMPVFDPGLINHDVIDFYAIHRFSDAVEEFQFVSLEPSAILKIIKKNIKSNCINI